MVLYFGGETRPGHLDMRRSTIAAAVLAFGLIGGLAAAARAQPGWPSRPLTMVVPFAAGGPVDLLGRIIAQYLGAELGSPVVIENVPGAGGMPGSQRVARANPDGYTFLLGSIGTHALNQSLYKHPLYDAANDFAFAVGRCPGAAARVDELAAGGGEEPGLRVIRRAYARPGDERGREGVRQRILGLGDIAGARREQSQ